MAPRRCSLYACRWIVLLITVCALFSPRSSTASELSFPLTLEEGSVVLETVGGLSRAQITDEGYAVLTDAGAPALPFRIVNILLPQGEAVTSFRFASGTRRAISENFQPLLSDPQVSENGITGKGVSLAATADESSIFPAELGRYLGTGYLHGCGIASFAVFPLQIAGGELILNSEITLIVSTEPVSGSDVAERLRYREGFQQERRRLVSSLALNPSEFNRYVFDEVRVEVPEGGFQPTEAPSLEGSPVDYVIITVDSLASAYQTLADLKTAKGVPTVVRTVEWIEANYRNGVDIQETIRFFIQDAYSKWGVKWVLLGGDTDEIPARYGYSRYFGNGTTVPADLYFACLDGSWNDTHDNLWGEGYYYQPMDNPDLYADVYVGRLPTSTVSEVDVAIGKIENYEAPVDEEYMDKLVFLAEVLFPVTWQPGQPINLNGADMSEFIYLTTLNDEPLRIARMYETDWLYTGSVPLNKQATLDSMESGYNHVAHIGHGFRFVMSVADASIQSSDAGALYHPDRFFNLYMLNCTAAAFDYKCLAEDFLRNPDGGAVSVIGANQSAFPNTASYYMEDYYELLFDDDVVHIGEVFARSRLNRTPIAESADNVDLWTHYIYTLLGDPEMPLWTEPVDTLDVFHVSNVDLGQNEILVNVTANSIPVDSAMVCLYKGTDDYQYATTNTLGNVTFDFTCETPGSISVVVTGLNHAKHQSYITVDSSVEAYVNLSDLTVDDDSVGTSYGNGDNVVDAGETVDMMLELINTGGASSDSVWIVLRCSDTLATVEDSIAAVGTVGSSNTKQALDPVRVHFASSAPDEAAVEFSVVIRDGSNEWQDTFARLVHAPVLDLITLRIDDSAPLGNGNGRNESYEEFKLHYRIKNYGTGEAYGLAAEIMDLDDAFVFFDSTDVYPDIAHIAEEENANGFHILETSTAEEHRLEVTITDLFGRTRIDTIELREPSPPSALVFDLSLGTDRIEVSWAKSDSADVARYRVYHSLDSGGPYDLRSVDPVEHTVYTDTDLLPSSLYYYVVTAIDSSGNESDPSGEFSASTNPPQLDGWPIKMDVETVCSPAIGDIDGDGDVEIVAGNAYLYAWHHDGQEMIDGDGDPQSWGVLCTYGLDFVAPITLANVDDVRGLDIIAASFSTKEIYCLTYEGDTIPGWPQSTEGKVRAAPVLGDLDGDYEMEIIAVDQGGVIYAWNLDGSEYRDGDSNPGTHGVFYRTPTPPVVHYQTPAICDIDDDDQDEIILGTQVDSVYVFNEDGTQVPGWPVGTNGRVAGSIAVGDIDDDDYFEMVVPTTSAEVLALNHDGSQLWIRWIAHNTFFSPSPALADFDGDGKLETVIAGSNKKLYLISHTGSDYPGWPIQYADVYTESSPVVVDMDDDGSPDIILGDETKYINGWDVNGNPLAGFPIGTEDAVRATPFIADIDGDLDIEMIVAGWDKHVYVWDFNSVLEPTEITWPTFHANIHRNGRYGSNVPTGIGDATVSYEVREGAVELLWYLQSPFGSRFDVYRGLVEDEKPTVFIPVFYGIAPDAHGIMKTVDRGIEMGCRYIYKLQRSDSSEELISSGLIYIPISRAALLQNYPNPFNPSTRITFYVPDGPSQRVSLAVYDITGARIRVLVDEVRRPGKYVEVWNGRNDKGNPVATGMYFYRLRQKGFVDTKKMLLLK